MFENALKTLRLNRDPTMEEVRKAYIRLTRRYPPEHFPEKYRQVKLAFEELTLENEHLQTKAREVLKADNQVDILGILLQEGLSVSDESEKKKACIDVRELSPILNANQHIEDLKTLISEIREQGLTYRG